MKRPTQGNFYLTLFAKTQQGIVAKLKALYLSKHAVIVEQTMVLVQINLNQHEVLQRGLGSVSSPVEGGIALAVVLAAPSVVDFVSASAPVSCQLALQHY